MVEKFGYRAVVRDRLNEYRGDISTFISNPLQRTEYLALSVKCDISYFLFFCTGLASADPGSLNYLVRCLTESQRPVSKTRKLYASQNTERGVLG